MDEGKRLNHKIKKVKPDSVRNIVSAYLRKRRYPNLIPGKITKKNFFRQVLLENRVSKPSSVLYSCYTTNRSTIEYNFSKFIHWLEDQIRNKHSCYDIEKIVGPVFCHFYLDLLSEHSDEAATFFKLYIDKVDKSKCDDLVRGLIKALNSEVDAADLKDKFRSKKTVVQLRSDSVAALKKFVSENGHILFLQVLQNWFDFTSIDEEELTNDIADNDAETHPLTSNIQSKDPKLSKLLSVMKTTKKLPPAIRNIRLSCDETTPLFCGFLKRQAGFLAYADRNVLRIMPTHNMNTLFALEEVVQQIKIVNHSKQIYCITISQDNTYLCTASADCSICIYNVSEMKLFKRVYGHTAPVYCVKISDNGKYLASGSADCTARMWSLKTGQTLRVFVGHTRPVTCLDFHPNTLYLATGSGDRNVRYWNTKDGSPARLLHGAKGAVYAVAHNPGGHYLACASEDRRIRIWDIAVSKVLLELKTKEASIVKLAWSTSGRELCGGTLKSLIKIWDLSTLYNHHNREHRYAEPIAVRKLRGGRLLFLEYSFGTFSTLTT